MPTRDDIERSATVLIRIHGPERASEWADSRARELLALKDAEGAEAMMWIARVIRRRLAAPTDLVARRQYRGDL
jgi:hypothetical protein